MLADESAFEMALRPASSGFAAAVSEVDAIPLYGTGLRHRDFEACNDIAPLRKKVVHM